MHKATLYIRRAILRWQLHNLDAGIRNILIARNHALATMMTLKEERNAKERLLEDIETLAC